MGRRPRVLLAAQPPLPAQGDHDYIIGEKLRSDSPEIKAALSRQGRYTPIAENMRVKEVKISDTEGSVICHNPDAATRDAHIRAQLVAQLEELIAGSDTLPIMKRGELRGRISTKLSKSTTRPARHARHPGPEADHRTRPRKSLTSGNTTT